MHAPLGFKICGMSFIYCLEEAKMMLLASVCYLRDISAESWIHTTHSKFVVALWVRFVLTVNAVIRIAQIAYAVVSAVTIHVVNLAFRPFPIMEKPCYSVAEILRAIRAHIDVSLLLPGAWADLANVGAFDSRENAGLRVVGEETPRLFKSKIADSHDAVSSLIGQRLAPRFQRGPVSKLYGAA
jgi:hypothetical protein